MQVIQESSVWQLAASVTSATYGHHLLISSYIPNARRPEHQVKFSGILSATELRKLRDTIDQALDNAASGDSGDDLKRITPRC